MNPEENWYNELPSPELATLIARLKEAQDSLTDYITKSRGQRGAFDHGVPEVDRANNLLQQVKYYLGILTANIPLNRTENTKIENLLQEINSFFSSIN